MLKTHSPEGEGDVIFKLHCVILKRYKEALKEQRLEMLLCESALPEAFYGGGDIQAGWLRMNPGERGAEHS